MSLFTHMGTNSLNVGDAPDPENIRPEGLGDDVKVFRRLNELVMDLHNRARAIAKKRGINKIYDRVAITVGDDFVYMVKGDQPAIQITNRGMLLREGGNPYELDTGEESRAMVERLKDLQRNMVMMEMEKTDSFQLSKSVFETARRIADLHGESEIRCGGKRLVVGIDYVYIPANPAVQATREGRILAEGGNDFKDIYPMKLPHAQEVLMEVLADLKLIEETKK